jgi:hypothetical protein
MKILVVVMVVHQLANENFSRSLAISQTGAFVCANKDRMQGGT